MRIPRVIVSLENILDPNRSGSERSSYAEFGTDQFSVTVPKDESHHLVHVLRAQLYSPVEVFVREWQKAFSSAIIAIHEDSVELKTEQLLSQSSPHPIHVIAPIIKFSRLELLVEKCVELGASSIRLYQAEHARPDAKFESLKKRCLRLEKIRDQALKQSRSVCNTQLQYFENLALSSPIMEEIVGIGLVLVSEKDALSLASPGNYRAFSSLLREFMKIKKSNKNDDLYLCVGPEGGFSKSELSCLEQKRFQATSLGPNVFRTETAAIAATAIACELLE